MVQGRCEKSCFPVLCDESNPRLKLRLVTNNPCVNRSSSLCQNYGKCLLMSLLAYECLCAQGWTGPDCSIPEGNNEKYMLYRLTPVQAEARNVVYQKKPLLR